MKGIDILRAEHETISIGLDVLSQICRRLENRERIRPTHLTELIQFFEVYADRCHHTKEEEFLFEALATQESAQIDRLVGSLCTQHVMSREFVHGMHEAADKYLQGQTRASKAFCLDAKAYTTLLRIHICDEDHVLFPLAAKSLDSLQRSEVTRECQALDKRLLAEEEMSKCLLTLQKLREVYVKPTGARAVTPHEVHTRALE